MFHIKIIAYDKEDSFRSPEAEIAAQLNDAGIKATFASKSLQDLGMNVERVAQYVEQNPSDAWIVCAGSREILEWFSNQSAPVMALHGGFTDLPIAAVTAMQTYPLKHCIARLVELGHRKIAMITREERRNPKPLVFEQTFLDEMKDQGLFIDHKTHLPDWEESLTGLRALLESLFKENPPTALLLQESQLAVETQQFLRKRNILMPEHVSLYCCDYSPNFNWSDPPIAHSRWDNSKVIARILQWAQNVARGEKDSDQTRIDTEFVEAGTIGPAPDSQ